VCGRCEIQQDVWAPPDPDGDGTSTPILRHLHPAFREAAQQWLSLTPAQSVLPFVSWTLQLPFVAANVPFLKTRGLYEADLLKAYLGSSGWGLDFTFTLFFHAEKDRLRAAADPFPDPLPTTLYRGVAGRKRQRCVQHMSWTSSLACACWFALRGQDPAVYQRPYSAPLVLAYVNTRHEDEYICYPFGGRRPKRMALTPEEMRAYKEQFEAERDARLVGV
jgi:hypothetical protein